MHGKSANPMRPSCIIKNKLMNANEILTREDLKAFKTELLQEIKTLLKAQSQDQNKKWLKSQEVRKMLIISPGTLQNLRVNGTLRYTKIGSLIYYKQEDINTLLEKGFDQ